MAVAALQQLPNVIKVEEDSEVHTMHNDSVPLIRAYQTIFLEKSAPDWPSLAIPALVAGLFVFLGALAFHRLHGEIVDEL